MHTHKENVTGYRTDGGFGNKISNYYFNSEGGFNRLINGECALFVNKMLPKCGNYVLLKGFGWPIDLKNASLKARSLESPPIFAPIWFIT
jgi:hypothetical protein